jgi:hypothetical protein
MAVEAKRNRAMAAPALAMTVDREELVARAKADRRRYRRVTVDLGGRLFVPADNHEATCKILDLSPGGAQVKSDFIPRVDAEIVLYVDGFGRFEGVVARPAEDSFGVKFNCSALKRERIAEQLMLLMNRGIVDDQSLRRHDRTPTKGAASFTRADGEIVGCEVMDLSLSGVSLRTHVRPPIGEIVLVGQMAGRIARHHQNGVAIEFVTPMPVDRPKLAVVK